MNLFVLDIDHLTLTLENRAVVVTRNRRDFDRVPGLIVEDWSS